MTIARVGRPANAAERGFQMAHERPELLEYLALNHYLFVTQGGTRERWAQFDEVEREQWRTNVLGVVQRSTANFVPTALPDGDPDPGGEPIASESMNSQFQRRSA